MMNSLTSSPAKNIFGTQAAPHRMILLCPCSPLCLLDASLHYAGDITRVATSSEDSVSNVKGIIPSKRSDRNITAIQRSMALAEWKTRTVESVNMPATSIKIFNASLCSYTTQIS